MSLLYLVAISAKIVLEKHLRSEKKKSKEDKERGIHTFLFSKDFSHHVFRRFGSKAVVIQTTRVPQVVKVVNPTSKF